MAPVYLKQCAGGRPVPGFMTYRYAGESPLPVGSGEIHPWHMNTYYVFVLASRRHRHFSIDVSVELRSGVRRIRQRVNRRLGRKRVLQKLVYVETMTDPEQAVQRVCVLLAMDRTRLAALIGSVNPGWDALSTRLPVAPAATRVRGLWRRHLVGESR